MASIHFKTAFSNIRRSPFQAAAAVFVLTITFFVITMLSIVVYSMDNVIRYFETRPQVILFLKDTATPTEVTKLQDKLKSDTRAKDINFVSKDKALSIYKDATSDNPLLSELVNPSIFPASIEFSLSDLNFAEAIMDELKTEAIVDQIGFTASLGSESALDETVSRLRTITKYVRFGGVIFVGILVITSFFVLLVVISMRLVARRTEVEILNLIGATSGFIRSPIIIESVFYSIFGVMLGWVLGLIVTLYTSPSVISYFSNIKVLPKDLREFFMLFGIILAAELLLGLMLSFGGSTLAVKRSKKAK